MDTEISTYNGSLYAKSSIPQSLVYPISVTHLILDSSNFKESASFMTYLRPSRHLTIKWHYNEILDIYDDSDHYMGPNKIGEEKNPTPEEFNQLLPML